MIFNIKQEKLTKICKRHLMILRNNVKLILEIWN